MPKSGWQLCHSGRSLSGLFRSGGSVELGELAARFWLSYLAWAITQPIVIRLIATAITIAQSGVEPLQGLRTVEKRWRPT
jgi:hypothetical protein